MGKGDASKGDPSPKGTPSAKKHRSKASKEHSRRRAGPRERKAGQYVRYSKPAAGPVRRPPSPPAKRPRAEQGEGEENDPGQDEPSQPEAPGLTPKAAAKVEARPGADSSSYEYGSDNEEEAETRPEKVVVVKRYQKQAEVQETQEADQSSQPDIPTDHPVQDEEAEPRQASKEKASGSSQPMQVDAPQEASDREGAKPTATKA